MTDKQFFSFIVGMASATNVDPLDAMLGFIDAAKKTNHGQAIFKSNVENVFSSVDGEKEILSEKDYKKSSTLFQMLIEQGIITIGKAEADK